MNSIERRTFPLWVAVCHAYGWRAGIALVAFLGLACGPLTGLAHDRHSRERAVHVSISKPQLNPATGNYDASVTVRNTSRDILVEAPAYLVVEIEGTRGIKLLGHGGEATQHGRGRSADSEGHHSGRHSHRVPLPVPSRGIAPGGAIAGITLSFANPRGRPFRIEHRLVARYTRLNVVASTAVGSTGGVVNVTNTASPAHGASVTIPPGALDSAQVITIAVAPPKAVPGGLKLIGPVVSLLPKGLTFRAPVTLTLPVTDLPDLDDAAIFYFPPDGPPSLVMSATPDREPEISGQLFNRPLRQVSVKLAHFSDYATAVVSQRPS